MSDLWWHNIPQCAVGDLVRYRSRKNPSGVYGPKGRDLWLVIETKPKKPCRVNPSQIVTVFDSLTGRTSKFDAKRLEVVNV